MLISRIITRTPPKWMSSFSYLLILMLSFFILLLSVSQLDVLKYKKMVLSLQYVLGITPNGYDNDLLPLNSSMVLQEYSNENTTAIVAKALTDNSRINFQDLAQSQLLGNAINNIGITITQDLTNEVQAGIIDIQTNMDSIVMCLNEKYSFESGLATIKNDSYPALYKIANIIAQTPGLVTVAGFTDDVPMQNSNFHDNWELSAMRACKVLSVLLENTANDPQRFTLIANAANHPLYPNNSMANRTKNRRVEITLVNPQEQKIPDHKNIKMLDVPNDAIDSDNT
jgi:chemotaxis protein MotB